MTKTELSEEAKQLGIVRFNDGLYLWWQTPTGEKFVALINAVSHVKRKVAPPWFTTSPTPC